MGTMKHKNLNHIKELFEQKTGATLTPKRPVKNPVRFALLTAVLLACFLSVTTFADDLFSSLEGDALGFCSEYCGDGIVLIEVENRSNKTLRFQEKIKVVQWTTAKEVLPSSGQISFDGLTVKPHSTNVMRIDLSEAYDLELLEKPLSAGDYYYLVLTNNNFNFGQDWMCSVDFAPQETLETISTSDTNYEIEADSDLLSKIEERIKWYFENVTFDIKQRTMLAAEYAQNCQDLFKERGVNVIAPVAPHLAAKDDVGIIFDETVSSDKQYELVGQQYHVADWKFKMLAGGLSEKALVISAALPELNGNEIADFLPLIYMFTYPKSQIKSDDDYIFVYGQLFRLADLEDNKVFEDDLYVSYDMTFAVYSDLWENVESFVEWRGDALYNEHVQRRIENIRNYYSEHLHELIFYVIPPES